jgi:hypothetical protein
MYVETKQKRDEYQKLVRLETAEYLELVVWEGILPNLILILHAKKKELKCQRWRPTFLTCLLPLAGTVPQILMITWAC